MNIANYTLCYNSADGKLHIGRGCTEAEEKLVGDITDEIAELGGYTGEGSVLRLKNFQFATAADIALAVPGGTTILFEGENEVKVVNDRADANVGVLYSSGDLTLDSGDNGSLRLLAETERGLWSRAICARAGDLTLNGGRIEANGGHAKKSCGVYAGGHLWIEIGDKGKIRINGGTVSVMAGKNAVRAAEGQLTVAAGARVENAQEFAGGDAWSGDCLSPVDEGMPLTVSFAGK